MVSVFGLKAKPQEQNGSRAVSTIPPAVIVETGPVPAAAFASRTPESKNSLPLGDQPIPAHVDPANIDQRRKVEENVRRVFRMHTPIVEGVPEGHQRDERAEGATFVWPTGDRAGGVLTVLDSRPGFRLTPFGANVGTAGDTALYLEAEGRTLLEFNTSYRYWVSGILPPQTVALRRTIADGFGVEPWDVEVAGTTVHDPELGRPRFDQIVITRLPSKVATDSERRMRQLREILTRIEDWHGDCVITEDHVSRTVHLSYAKRRRLPEFVSLAELAPDQMRPDDWAKIPLGIGPDGRLVNVDLTAGPHELAVGPTGTGKTVLLVADAVGRLIRGHRIVMIDPTKAGLDFIKLRPYISLWANNLESARETILRVYAEVARRKEVLKHLEEVKWSDVEPEARRKHGLFPLTVILDEYGSLVLPEDVPKALPKDDPYRLEAEQRNISRAILAGTVGRIAREARFAGVHLVIALQRPDASIISGELRSNLTSAVQLSPPGKPLSREALTMVFPGEVNAQAAAVLSELDDGVSKGLAVTAAEGGTAAGFRVAFTPPKAIPELLEAIGVPLGSDDDVLAEVEEQDEKNPSKKETA